MNVIRELTLGSIAFRIFLAFVLGGVVGLERGIKNRPAGLRTYMLVCLGACMVMMTNQYVYQLFGGDPSRMGAQVVSGIGFLGAGTIIVTARNQIKGLTTAAGLWAAACAGLAVGIGFYELAILGGIAIFIILAALHEMDGRMRKNTKVVEVYVELKKRVTLGEFMRFTRANEIETTNLQMENEQASTDEAIAFVVTLKGLGSKNHDEIICAIRSMEGVQYVDEL